MKIFILGALLVLSWKPCNGRNPFNFNVIHFKQEIEKEETKVEHLLEKLKIITGTSGKEPDFKPVDILKQWESSHVKNLGTFSWKNCGKPGDVIIAQNLSISPDPVVLPGSLSIGFNVTARKQVTAPLTADVLIEKKVGETYITVPCLGNFGSCHYEDFCALLKPIPQCPPQFLEHDIPCHCPLEAGNYSLPDITFPVGGVPLPSGQYHGKIDMTYTGTHVGCIEIYVSIDAGLK